MTLINYTDPVPLPAPVTTAGPLYNGLWSFTDPTGEIWVAKSGVSNGNWARARDVLYCRVFRNAAYTFQTSGTILIPMDSVTRDVYGLFSDPAASGTGGIIMPISGYWRFIVNCRCNPTAAGQNFIIYLMSNNATQVSVQNAVSGSASYAASVSISESWYVSGTNPSWTMNGNTQPALPILTGSIHTYLSAKYEGTG